jgi:glucose/arabinose dehydrogenase
MRKRLCVMLAISLFLAACGADAAAPGDTTGSTSVIEQPADAVPTDAPAAEPTAATTEATPAAGEPVAPEPTPAEPTTEPAEPTAASTEGAGTLPMIAYREIADGFTKPIYLTHAGDGSGRLFVVEQAGVIKILRGESVAENAFLDITDRVGSDGSEQGLLSVAFHPEFGDNGLLFVDYTDKDGDTVISRFQASGDAADPGSEEVLLTIDQPYRNHNGGLLKFGPDGYLYIGMGDGGSAGDPEDRAKNLEELLGKILRIDINQGDPFAIPSDNPWADGGGRPEIWAYGLRNPWRFSFDRQTGDLYIGDVGQGKLEEIDFQPAGEGGQNYGWNLAEGSECYTDGCDLDEFVGPVAEYPHADGCSVTGGYVYRGETHAVMQGMYFFGDYCTGTVWALPAGGQLGDAEVVLEKGEARISSFGEDEAGELYVVDLGGQVFQVVPA